MVISTFGMVCFFVVCFVSLDYTCFRSKTRRCLQIVVMVTADSDFQG